MWYTYNMDNQNDVYNDMGVPNMNGQQPVGLVPQPLPPEAKKRKLWPWLVGSGVIIAVVIVIVVVILNNNTPSDYTINDNIGPIEMHFERNDAYSEIQNIFLNVGDDMDEEFLQAMLQLGGVDNGYLQLNKDIALDNGDEDEYNTSNETKSYIAATTIDPEADYTDQDIEYISFNYVPDSEDDSTGVFENFTYHRFHNGNHGYVNQTSDYEYTHHYDDEYANTFRTKKEALDDLVMRD